MSTTFQNLKVTNNTDIIFIVTCNGQVATKPLAPGDSYTFKNVNAAPVNGIKFVISGSDVPSEDQITLTSNSNLSHWSQTVNGQDVYPVKAGVVSGETLSVGLKKILTGSLAGVVIVGTVDTGGYIE